MEWADSCTGAVHTDNKVCDVTGFVELLQRLQLNKREDKSVVVSFVCSSVGARYY
jgi:hypothetical protein